MYEFRSTERTPQNIAKRAIGRAPISLLIFTCFSTGSSRSHVPGKPQSRAAGAHTEEQIYN